MERNLKRDVVEKREKVGNKKKGSEDKWNKNTVDKKTFYRAKTLYHDTFPINFKHLDCQNNLIFLHDKT
jgi:hypothetical protein